LQSGPALSAPYNFEYPAIMKILVTGAAGFIGMHTSQLLLARGDQVVGLDNLNDYYEVQLKHDRLARLTPHENFRFVKMDVADNAGMAKLFAEEKFDKVIHLAAQAGVRYSLVNPQAYVESNLVGFMNILEGMPSQQGQAPGLRFQLQRVRWQHPHALLRDTTASITR
jgi:nucleoside-diphosphate-sugar epimerase